MPRVIKFFVQFGLRLIHMDISKDGRQFLYYHTRKVLKYNWMNSYFTFIYVSTYKDFYKDEQPLSKQKQLHCISKQSKVVFNNNPFKQTCTFCPQTHLLENNFFENCLIGDNSSSKGQVFQNHQIHHFISDDIWFMCLTLKQVL